MLKIESLENPAAKRPASAFTLAEVVMAVAITTLIFGGILTANVHLTKRAEWTGQSLAAQALAIQQLEQARSAVWDNSLGKNELTNLNLLGWTSNGRVGKGYSHAILDLPISGTNYVRATNYVTITQLTNVTGLAGVRLQMVQVDTVWRFRAFGSSRLHTNTVVTYYAPDNPDASNL